MSGHANHTAIYKAVRYKLHFKALPSEKPHLAHSTIIKLLPGTCKTLKTHINIHLSKMFPHKGAHTPCFSELVCYIAERSSKHSPQRHSALLPESSSKSCPRSGEVGGQLWFGEANQASCIRLLVFTKKCFAVLHSKVYIAITILHQCLNCLPC